MSLPARALSMRKETDFHKEALGRNGLQEESNMGNGICWLQSIEQKGICFIMLNPLEICPDYAPAVMQDVLFTLQAVPKDDLDCWVIAVIGDTFRESTVNLKSPIIINHKTNLGMQVILDQDYPIRQPIFDSKGGGVSC